jgi:hypothetical protein
MSTSKVIPDLEQDYERQQAVVLADAAARLRDLVSLNLAVDGEMKIVAFVDELFPLAVTLGDLNCTAVDDRALQFRTRGQPLCEVELACARGKLRMLCARLAVICSKRTGREFSPYGEEAEFDLPLPSGQCVPFKVRFTNTPDRQEFNIEADRTQA